MTRLRSHRRELNDRPPAVGSPAEAIRRLLGRGSAYTTLLAIQMLAGIAFVPAITRLLSPSAYGEVAASVVVYSMIVIGGPVGLPDAASRTFFMGSDGPREARRLVAAAACVAAMLAVLVELTGTLWAPLFGLKYGGALEFGVLAGAAGAAAVATQSLFRVAERVWAFGVVSLVSAIGGQAAGLALTVWLRTPAAYMAGIAVGSVLAAGIGLAQSGAFRDGVAGLGELRRGLSLGAPIVPHSLSVYLLASADRILIAAVLGLAATGRYQVAYAVGGLGVALVTAINQAWIPIVLGAQQERRWEVLTATSEVVYAVVGLLASLLALAAPLALLVAASSSYDRHSLVPVAAIVAFSALPYAAAGTYFQVVFVTGRTRVMALAAPLSAAVNIALNLILLPVIGLVGASFATVAAYAVLPAVVAVRARRIVRLRGAFRGIVRSWLVSAPFVAAGALLPTNALGTILRAALCVAAVGMSYWLLRSALRASPPAANRGAAEAVDDDLRGEDRVAATAPPIVGAAP